MKSERDSRMMIRADARAIGAVTAIDQRGSERWKSSNTKNGECVSIFPDGTVLPFSAAKSRKYSTPKIKMTATDKRNRYQNMLDKYGAIGCGE